MKIQLNGLNYNWFQINNLNYNIVSIKTSNYSYCNSMPLGAHWAYYGKVLVLVSAA